MSRVQGRQDVHDARRRTRSRSRRSRWPPDSTTSPRCRRAGRLLVFPLAEMREVPRGRGVIIMGLDGEETLAAVGLAPPGKVVLQGTNRVGRSVTRASRARSWPNTGCIARARARWSDKDQDHRIRNGRRDRVRPARIWVHTVRRAAIGSAGISDRGSSMFQRDARFSAFAPISRCRDPPARGRVTRWPALRSRVWTSSSAAIRAAARGPYDDGRVGRICVLPICRQVPIRSPSSVPRSPKQCRDRQRPRAVRPRRPRKSRGHGSISSPAGGRSSRYWDFDNRTAVDSALAPAKAAAGSALTVEMKAPGQACRDLRVRGGHDPAEEQGTAIAVTARTGRDRPGPPPAPPVSATD